MEKQTKGNFSRKRTAILKTLKETNVHPTADWIYSQLKPRYPNLSLGTVYRNLKKFCDDGDAISVGVIGGQEHFDGDTRDHTHFVCSDCGQILDIPETLITEDTLTRIHEGYGMQVHNVSLTLSGVCETCNSMNQKLA